MELQKRFLAHLQGVGRDLQNLREVASAGREHSVFGENVVRLVPKLKLSPVLAPPLYLSNIILEKNAGLQRAFLL